MTHVNNFRLRGVFGVSLSSQMSIFATTISCTLMGLAIFGIVPTMYMLGILQVSNLRFSNTFPTNVTKDDNVLIL